MYSNSQSYELFDDSARNNNNYQSFPQKISGKFAGFEKTSYLCTRLSGFSAVGSAHVWGARGRWFESSNPDRKKEADNHKVQASFFFIAQNGLVTVDVLVDARGIFRLNKAIYVSFLLNSLIFYGLSAWYLKNYS